MFARRSKRSINEPIIKNATGTWLTSSSSLALREDMEREELGIGDADSSLYSSQTLLGIPCLQPPSTPF